MMVLFAVLQWNDIDAPIWICIYLTTALLALITYKEICLPCTIAWTIMVVIFAIYMLMGVIPAVFNLLENNAYAEIFFAMNNSKPHIEQTREALGLLIILFYCATILIHIYTKQKHTSPK